MQYLEQVHDLCTGIQLDAGTHCCNMPDPVGAPRQLGERGDLELRKVLQPAAYRALQVRPGVLPPDRARCYEDGLHPTRQQATLLHRPNETCVRRVSQVLERRPGRAGQGASGEEGERQHLHAQAAPLCNLVRAGH